MKIFKYSIPAKLLYRYGNIPITILLTLYIFIASVDAVSHWYFIVFILINIYIIIAVNKYFFKTYKSFPFLVEADNEKIICSNFFFSTKQVQIKHINIDKISGGIFSGYPTRPVYIHDAMQDITIGFYTNSKELQSLLKIILQNITEDLYRELLGKLRNARNQE
jgi:hypothetical protein